MTDTLREAVELARFMGAPELDCTILAEGNVSARADADSFWVKASGLHMGSISSEGFVRVRFEPILSALDGPSGDERVRELLTEACVSRSGMRPSVETFMHAYLLSLPGVAFVAHGHPTPLVSLLCLAEAPELAKTRLFPDEVVCCGPAAAFVSYTDPGLSLANAVHASVERHTAEFGGLPRTIWIANHGLVVLGESPAEVRNAVQMSIKAARAWLGALSTGKTIKPLAKEQVERIHSRPDEHYRQRLLKELRGRVTV